MGNKLKITVSKDYENLRSEILSVPDTIDNCGRIIYKDRNTIYNTEIGGINAAVKAFHVPAALNRIIYTFFRHSKARRSFDNAVRLKSLNIGTPNPIAYIEEYSNGLLKRSYYIYKAVEAQHIRHWETDVENYKEMIHHFAAFIYDLHSKGVYHKDFSPGNILFNTDETGKYRFFLIDINRMKFNVFNKKTLYRNFRCLNIDSEEETARVAREYAVQAGLDSDKMGNMAIGLLRKYHAEKRFHRRFKRLFHHRQQL